jgi:recombination protein U
MAKKEKKVNYGKRFEEDIKNSVTYDMWYLRIQDSATSFNGGNQSRFTLKNKFDALFHYNYNLYCVELKSSKQSSISMDRDKKDKKSIKLHQIEGLQETIPFNGINGGFLFNLRESKKNGNITYWMGIENFLNFYNNCDKKSINENDMINNGAIVVEQSLKIKRYKYDLRKIFNSIRYNIKEE